MLAFHCRLLFTFLWIYILFSSHCNSASCYDPRCCVMWLVWSNHQVIEAERLPKAEISMEKWTMLKVGLDHTHFKSNTPGIGSNLNVYCWNLFWDWYMQILLSALIKFCIREPHKEVPWGVGMVLEVIPSLLTSCVLFQSPAAHVSQSVFLWT